MKSINVATVIIILLIGASITVERLYVSKLEKKFIVLEKKRIVTSNKLATAKIVSENLNHVRDLVYKNMDFKQQGYSQARENDYFAFLTSCVNDLKLKLVSLRPVNSYTKGRVTVYPYDIEIEGNFFKFGELCAKFENSHRIISTETFEVEQINEEHKRGDSKIYRGIKVNMRVNTYWIRKN